MLGKEVHMTTYFSKHSLWVNQAPSWNFELNADQLLAKALEVGFVTKVEDDCFELNEDYGRTG